MNCGREIHRSHRSLQLQRGPTFTSMEIQRVNSPQHEFAYRSDRIS
jgi:hypothetical protein